MPRVCLQCPAEKSFGAPLLNVVWIRTDSILMTFPLQWHDCTSLLLRRTTAKPEASIKDLDVHSVLHSHLVFREKETERERESEREREP